MHVCNIFGRIQGSHVLIIRGGLADVGVVGGTVYPTCKVLVLLKDYVSVICLLKHHVVRETKQRRSSLVGKSAQTSAECTM